MHARFELVDGSHNKFWEMTYPFEGDPTKFKAYWGRIGSAGQFQVKEFHSAAQAEAASSKLIAEKEKKGYRRVSAKKQSKAPAKKPSRHASTSKCAHCGRRSSGPAHCPEPWEHSYYKGGCKCAWCVNKARTGEFRFSVSPAIELEFAGSRALPFPTDMLRYDHAEFDSSKDRKKAKAKTAGVILRSSVDPTDARWASFGWQVDWVERKGKRIREAVTDEMLAKAPQFGEYKDTLTEVGVAALGSAKPKAVLWAQDLLVNGPFISARPDMIWAVENGLVCSRDGRAMIVVPPAFVDSIKNVFERRAEFVAEDVAKNGQKYMRQEIANLKALGFWHDE